MLRPALVACLLLVSACAGRGPFGPDTDLQTSRVPAPVGFPLATQPTLESAAHWQAAARQVAAGAAQAYRAAVPDLGVPVFVAPMGTTAFAKNFHAFVTGELSRHGLPVAAAPDGAMVLEASTEVVQHRWPTQGQRVRDVVEPGFVQAKDERGRYQDVPVVREDRALYTQHAPATEMILTAALYHGQAVLFHASTVFYIPPEERGLYLKAPAAPASPLKHYILVE